MFNLNDRAVFVRPHPHHGMNHLPGRLIGRAGIILYSARRDYPGRGGDIADLYHIRFDHDAGNVWGIYGQMLEHEGEQDEFSRSVRSYIRRELDAV